MALKGVVHIIESTISLLIIFSFITLISSKEVYQPLDIQSQLAYYATKNLVLSGKLDKALKNGNLTEINSELAKIIPWEFQTGIKNINISSYIIKASKNLTIVINKSEISEGYIDFITPEAQEVNISVNSNQVFSSDTSESYGIDIYPYLKTGENKIEVKKSGSREVYLILKLISQNIPSLESNENIITIDFPYYIEGVKILYVFI